MNPLTEMWQVQELLDEALERSGEVGLEAAVAEAEYHRARSEAALRMKRQGYPATVVQIAVDGLPKVSQKLEDWRKSQVMYEQAREARNVLKKRYDALREQAQREWTRAGDE